jgi:hypothetical protein
VAVKPDPSAGEVLFFCDRCGAELRPGSGNFYVIRIEAVADPTAPQISAEQLAGDLREQIEQTIALMQDLSSKEAMDQVYRRLTLYLCVPCCRRRLENPTG